ncbi:MAG: hypothetical protein ACON4U_19770 [Myxococcota bacterium]
MKPTPYLWLVLCVVYGLAVGYRLQIVDIIDVGSDTLSPLWSAMGVLHHGWSDPPNPESDHWLWVTHLPLMWGRNLHEVFVFRCAQAAVIAPLASYTVWILSSHRIGVSLVAGLLLALDPGLRDTLVVGFRGYGAPEWFMLSFFGLVAYSQNKRWGILIFGAAWVIASGQHSLTFGAIVGVFYSAFVFTVNPKDHLLLLFTLGLTLLPRLLWVGEVLQCDEGGVQCLMTIASGSSESELSVWDTLIRGLQDRFHVEWSWMALIGLLGLKWVEDSRLSRGVLLMAIGILILGLALHTLRPYHLRIFVGPLVVCASVGWWQRFEKWGELLLCFWLVLMVSFQMAPIGSPSALKSHDEIGQVISKADRKIWVETHYSGEELYFDPSAAVVSAYLQGWDTTHLACAPSEAEIYSVIEQTGQNWELHQFDHRQMPTELLNRASPESISITMYDAAVQVCPSLELE